ncbi:MAG: hypothetical protein IK088_01245, partial [Lachnospiraceae bacterium]|nr:hypothetical protein [Lachnospiraceae bacterium]
DPFTISKHLAGNTAPFLRLSGAPYWQDRDYPGGSKDRSKMIEMIDMSRLERSWYPGEDIEIVSEGDTYPRPRHHCPASFLNLFDGALRSDGRLDGIMHYSMDYVSSADYERGYIDSHVRMAEDLDRLYETFSSAETVGLRVYDSMKKIEDADFSLDPVSPGFVRNQFFTRSVRYTSHNSLPVTFYGSGCAGLLFGESARHFGPEILKKPLILDAAAAMILKKRGIDTGIVSMEKERFRPSYECWKNGEHTLLCNDYKKVFDDSCAVKLTLDPKAEVLSRFDLPSGLPASYSYENADGQKFLVFAVNAYVSLPDYYRSYMRQAQIFDFLEKAGSPLPVKTLKHPDLYVVAARSVGALHVALFNCFPDEIFDLDLEVSGCFGSAEFHRAEGTLSGRTVTIRHLAAFDWCYLTLS